MAVRTKKAAAPVKDAKGRRGPLAHSGNGYEPAHAFLTTLRGTERQYGNALLAYIVRGGTRPEPTCSPERGRVVQETLFNLFATEDPS